MPDLLILSDDTSSSFKLEQLAKTRGFRVKVSQTVESTVDWLRIKPFDALFIHAGVRIEDQQRLGGHLWEKNPTSQLIVFDLTDQRKVNPYELKLFGAEIARGPNAMEIIERALASAQKGIKDEAKEFRIMVVEDLDSPRDIICAYIENLGFSHVYGMTSAREAISELQSAPRGFDCIITDLKMPEIGGKELIEMIRRNERLNHIPIIVLTAYGNVDTLVECLRAGASGFLVKPPRKGDLTRELSRAIRMVRNNENPRLASPDEADSVRTALIDRGFA